MLFSKIVPKILKLFSISIDVEYLLWHIFENGNADRDFQKKVSFSQKKHATKIYTFLGLYFVFFNFFKTCSYFSLFYKYSFANYL